MMNDFPEEERSQADISVMRGKTPGNINKQKAVISKQKSPPQAAAAVCELIYKS